MYMSLFFSNWTDDVVLYCAIALIYRPSHEKLQNSTWETEFSLLSFIFDLCNVAARIYKYYNSFLIVYIYTTIYRQHTQKNKSDQLNVIFDPLNTVNAKEDNCWWVVAGIYFWSIGLDFLYLGSFYEIWLREQSLSYLFFCYQKLKKKKLQGIKQIWFKISRGSIAALFNSVFCNHRKD